jgi:hypothetical protein
MMDGAGRDAIEATSAWSLATPQFLQKSQVLRHNAPQLWQVPMVVSEACAARRAPHIWQKFSPFTTRAPQRVQRGLPGSASTSEFDRGRPHCLQKFRFSG